MDHNKVMTLLVLRNGEDGTRAEEYDNFEAFVKEITEDTIYENPQWKKCDCPMCRGKGSRFADYECFVFYELAKKGHLNIQPKEVVTEYVLE